MAATAAQFAALLGDQGKVAADQAVLLTDTTTQTTDQAAFAAGLSPGQVVAYIPTPPTSVYLITQDSTQPQGFTVVQATVLS